jgi:nucleoside-diphosphate-sugar epimerase
VTGTSGYLGAAVTRRLLRTESEVVALTRDAEHAQELSRAGAHPVVGDLIRPETYLAKLRNCDAAVHTAEANDDTRATVDQLALASFREAAEDGRLRKLVYTSGVWVLGGTGSQIADESWTLHPLALKAWRAAHEEIVMDLAQQEVATVILRPGVLYGGRRGIVGGMFREAQERGTVTYWGDGAQYWSMGHVDDVADAYALSLEHASGERYYLSDGADVTVREVAEAIARATGAEPRAMPADEVLETLGLYGQALLTSARVSPAKARRELGWVTRHTSFTAEVSALWRDWLGPREASVT